MYGNRTTTYVWTLNTKGFLVCIKHKVLYLAMNDSWERNNVIKSKDELIAENFIKKNMLQKNDQSTWSLNPVDQSTSGQLEIATNEVTGRPVSTKQSTACFCSIKNEIFLLLLVGPHL